MNRITAFRAQFLATLVVGLIALIGGFVLAQAPDARAAALGLIPNGFAPPFTMNYQGFLRLDSGVPMTGTHDITVKIYDQPLDGTQLHEESFEDVIVRDGMFNVVLGANSSMVTAFATPNRFIGISVDGADEYIPRERVHSVPWAIAAWEAEKANTASSATTATFAQNAIKADTLSGMIKYTYLHDNTAGLIPVTITDFLPRAVSPTGACFLIEVKVAKVWSMDTWPASEAQCSISNDDLIVGANTRCRVQCIDFNGLP